MGTNWAPLKADWFLFILLLKGFNKKSKQFHLVDRFNDISRYLDGILAIDNPEFAKHITDIYSTELHLNEANISDKETSLLG